MGLSATVYGFRSAFKDWAVESTSFPDAVSEAALAHKDADKVRSAYRRTDFRRPTPNPPRHSSPVRQDGGNPANL